MSYFDCEQDTPTCSGFVPGTEAINYQPDSTLAVELEEFFQEIADRVRKVDLTEQQTYDSWLVGLYRDCSKNGWYTTRLKTILQKNIGIGELILIPNIDPCIDAASIGKYDATLQYLIRSEFEKHEGGGKRDHPLDAFLSIDEWVIAASSLNKNMQDKAQTVIAALKEIGQSYDPKTGKFSTTSVKMGKINQTLDCYLGFPIQVIATSLIDNVAYRNNKHLVTTVVMTPREWTAIYLHEMGHFFETLQRIADSYTLNDIALRTAEVCSTNDKRVWRNGDTYRSFAEAFGTLAGKLNDPMAESMLKVTTTILNNAGQFVDLAKAVDENTPLASILDGIAYAVSSIIRIFISFIMAVLEVRSLLIPAILILAPFAYGLGFSGMIVLGIVQTLGFIYKFLNGDYSVTPTIKGNKTSEQTANPWLRSEGERAADAVSSRFGYGADLASGLSKLAGVVYSSNNMHRYDVPYTRSRLLNVLNRVLSRISSVVFLYYALDENVHNEGTRRINSILADHYRFLAICKNDPNLDNNYVKRMIVNTDLLRKQLEDAKENPYNNKIIRTIFVILKWLVDPKLLRELIFDGRLPADYALLRQQLEQVTHSNLYYWSEKIDTNSK